MNAKTILITGATDGLGRGVAAALADQGHTLLLHGRRQERLDTVARTLDTTVRTYRADLASLQAVRGLTNELLDAEDHIDVLVANAGIGGGTRQESVDGYELNFAVNYLSQFVLITRLLGRLRASAPARIVLVSSPGQTPINFDDVMLEHGYDGMRAYSQSKLAQIAFGFRLARQLDPVEVTVTSLHPATLMPTKMVRAGAGIPSIPSSAASRRPHASPSRPSFRESPASSTTASTRLRHIPGPRIPRSKNDCGSSASS